MAGQLLTSGAGEIARTIAAREISCAEVMELHLARIAAVNPRLNAVVAEAPERSRDAALAADRVLAQDPQGLGPLHGVPFTIKDSFDTADFPSTGGTMGRKDFIPDRDATVVARLRAAGGILIGKTNTPELTMGGETVNDIYGRTANPYDLARSPSGSSGGAAAIIAAGGSAFDIGTDTGGSIRDPAHVCGICGLKPTAGRVPMTGHIVGGDFGVIGFLTQAGPMARKVADLELLLGVIAGPDGIDPAVAPVALERSVSVDAGALRIAWCTDNGKVEADPAIADAVRRAAAALEARGLGVSEAVPPLLAEVEALYARLRDGDGASCLERLLARCGTAKPSAQLQLRMDRAETMSGDELSAVAEDAQRLRAGMLEFLTDFDVLICPPALHAAVKPETAATSNYEDWAFQPAFNLTGWPAVVLRGGSTAEGLPVGVQIAAGPWQEHVALAVASIIEEASGGYPAPEI